MHGGLGAHDFDGAAARFANVLRCPASCQKGVVGVVILPFAVTPAEVDIVAPQPLTNRLDATLSIVVVDNISVGHVHLIADEYRVVRTQHPDVDAVTDATLDQRLS